MAVEDVINTLRQSPAAAPACWIVCYEDRPLQGVPPGGAGPHLLIFTTSAQAEAFIAGRARYFMPEPLSGVAVDSPAVLKQLANTPARDPRYELPPCGLLLNFTYPTGQTDKALTPSQVAELDASGLAEALGLKVPPPPALGATQPLIPAGEDTVVVPSTEATVVTPVAEATVVVPGTEATVVTPVVEATVVVPGTEATVVMPVAEATVVAPVVEDIVIAPGTEATVVTPVAEATVVVPVAGATVIKPAVEPAAAALPADASEPVPPAPAVEPSPPAALPRARRGLPGWAWALLVIALLALCCLCCALVGVGVWAANGAGGLSLNLPGSGLPGARGTPVEYVGTPDAGIDVAEVYVNTDVGRLDTSQAGRNVLPSGASQLFLGVTFKQEPPRNTTISWEVYDNAGPLTFSGGSYWLTTRSSATGEVSVSLTRSAAGGTFPDGPYQAKLSINDKLLAVVNWTVGGPGAPTPSSGQTAVPATPTKAAVVPTLAPTVPLPTATRRPGAALQPPATPFACASPHVIDFSSVLQFGTFNEDYGRGAAKDGEYYIQIKQVDSWAGMTDKWETPEGIFEVDVRKAAGTGRYGLMFGLDNRDDWKEFYLFLVDSDGYYYLSRYADGQWADLKTRSFSPYIYTGDKTNRLKVVHSGPLIALYANGVLLTSAIYDSRDLRGLYFGLAAWGSRDSADLEARFDNLFVCPLTGAYQMPLNPFTRKTQRWPADRPIAVNWTWLAADPALAKSFVGQAEVTVIVDGKEYAVTPEYWGAPSPAPGGYAVQFNAPLPILSSGQHRVELRINLPQEITSGLDENKDGKPDTYGPGEAFKEWTELTVE